MSAFLLATIAGCTAKCGKGSDAGVAAGGKAEYIKTLDAICTKAAETGKEIPAMMAQIKPDTDPVEKLRITHSVAEKGYTVVDSMTREMEKIPQPAEDAAALKEIWANQKKVVELLSSMTTTSKKMADLAAEQLAEAEEPAEAEENGEEGEEAPAEDNADLMADESKTYQDLGAQVSTLNNTLGAQAKKYGFTVCFNPK